MASPPTFGCLGAGADALIHAIDFLSLHADILKPFVVCIDAMLEQFAQSHRAGEEEAERVKSVTHPEVTSRR